jgi:hypothetical protein
MLKNIGYDVTIQTAIIALMMEAARTSEMSVNFYQTTQRNSPEDSHLHTRRHVDPQISLVYV